ncbi:MAG: class I SAM-dependent methyltransferase [Propionibacteriaceae bacterium]|nr:class I SAM-dependent methyltransferase [Propionibacteriaceae bacterium]
MDDGGLAALRTELLADLTGSVVEVGCGTGSNFQHYPGTVTSVHAVEPEPYLRSIAHTEALDAPVDIKVTGGTGSALPLETASVDAAVLCMVLCSVPDPLSTVTELLRALRPGGTLVFLEHHASDKPGIRLIQKAADATLWPFFAGGCHLHRDPLTTLRAGGFVVESLRSPQYPGGLSGAFAPHVLGRASRP